MMAGMLFQRLPLPYRLAVILALAQSSLSSAAESPHSLSVGARRHVEHSAFSTLPFRNGDMSYGLAYQYTEKIGIWQLALDVAPDVSGFREVVSGTTTNNVGVDFILTPQMNVIIIDRFFRGGGGIRTSYIRDVDGNGEWLDPYWQFQLGLCFPLIQKLSLDVSAYYIYEEWDKLDRFKFGDIEYGAWLNYAF